MTELEQIIGYTFKNPELLKEALTHSSYTNGKHLRSNERLEFLGDSVLSIVVSEHLFENLTNLPEGQLTKIRASVVCENALYPFARKIDLGKYIFLGKEKNIRAAEIATRYWRTHLRRLLRRYILTADLKRQEVSYCRLYRRLTS